MTSPRQRILREAARIHDREGIDAVSMRAVASQIGVTATAIYRHFRDKDALIEALADTGFAMLLDVLQRKNRRHVSSWRDIMRNFLDFAFEHPRLYELMFLRKRARMRVFPEDFAARRSPPFNLLREALERDSGKKYSLEDALSIWAHAHGLISMFTLGRFGNDRQAFRRLYVRAMNRHFNGLRRNK
jgi:AcrR family transcriptional regulator